MSRLPPISVVTGGLDGAYGDSGAVVSLIRQTAWAAAATVVISVSRFALAAILARRLSMDLFGKFAFAQWLVDVVFLACSLGVTGVLARYVAEYRHDAHMASAMIRRALPFAMGLPLVAGIVVIAGVKLSDVALSAEDLAALGVWTVANGAWAMQTAVLTGSQRFDLMLVANALAAAVMLGGALLVPSTVMSPATLFVCMAAAAAAGTTVGLRSTLGLIGVVPSSVDRRQSLAIRRYAFNIWVTALLWSFVWSRGELPVVLATLGEAGVAQYSVALALFGAAIQCAMLPVAAAGPQLTRLWGEGSHEAAVALARQFLDTQLLVCGFAAIASICLGPELIAWVFGGGYRDQAYTLAILAIGLLSMSVSSQSHLLQIASDGRFTRNATFAGLVVLLCVSVWAIPALGLPGAAVARVSTMVIVAAVTLHFARTRWGKGTFSLGNVAAASLTVAGSAALVLAWQDLHWYVRAGLAAVAASILIAAIRAPSGRTQTGVVGRFVRKRLFGQAAAPRKAG